MTWIDELHATLGRRAAPEQVARIILASGIRWPADVQVRLDRVVSARRVLVRLLDVRGF